MDNLHVTDKSFLEKLQNYYMENPGRCCDVSFLVGSGSRKEIIRASRIILEVTCPEFVKLFDQKWGQAIYKIQNGEKELSGIPLADKDPRAFKLFLKLLTTENISVDSLKTFNFSPEDLLNVIELCREFRMQKIQQILEKMAQETIFNNAFSAFVQTTDFLKLSQTSLKTILLSNELEADETLIFEAAVKWAESRCVEDGIESTGENLRKALGDALFGIRFPTMSVTDFAKDIRLRSILTEREQLEIFRYTGLSDEDKLNYEGNDLAFDTTKRLSSLFATVKFFNGFNVVNNPSFTCDGTQKTNVFKVNKRIALQSIGFLGPIESDSFYDVTLEIKTGSAKSCGKVEKKVFAKRDKIFYVSFNKPIVIDATYSQDGWAGKHYLVHFTLKGPKTATPVIDSGSSWKDFRTDTDEGIGFYCQFHNYPMAEFRFSRC